MKPISAPLPRRKPSAPGSMLPWHRIKCPSDDIEVLAGERRIDGLAHVHKVAGDPLALDVAAENGGLEAEVIGGFIGKPASGNRAARGD